jgi:hypothetical protein
MAWINEAGGSLADTDVARIVEALNLQAPDIAAAWHISPPHHLVATDAASAPSGAMKCYFLPNADAAHLLGYHDVDPHGDPYLRVFVDLILQNNGTMLSGATSVSAGASHEAAEAAVDPRCDSYSAPRSDGSQVAMEVADAVENTSYRVTLADGTKVSVTNFVFPSYFEASGSAPFDQCQLVTSPFQILNGGYEVVRDPSGAVSQRLGDGVAPWRQSSKRFEASRTYRRLHPPGHSGH